MRQSNAAPGEGRFRMEGVGIMIRPLDEAEHLLDKGWRLEAIRTLIRKDSEAARAAQHETVTVATGNVFHPLLVLEKGTSYKEAMRRLREYRRDNEVFGKLQYATDWR